MTPAKASIQKRLWQKIQVSAFSVLAAPLLFFLVANILARYAGIHTDEALFAGPLCRSWRFFAIKVGHFDVPMMNMPYVGTLKTWLYAPLLLHSRHPNAALIRKPVILLGCLTILAFWSLLCRLHSRRAAWFGCILLATDASFLLMTTFDWGPVVLQHLLLVSTLLLSVRWFQTNGGASLAGAAFCCGLAFWDKAEFVWMFSGLCAGLLIIVPRLRPRLTVRRAATVPIFLLLGTLPVIIYNARGNPKLGTLHSNPNLGVDLRSPGLLPKLEVLRSTFSGSVLFGFLVNEDSALQPKSPRTKSEHMSFTLHQLAGDRRRNGMPLALCVGLMFVPWLWGTRARGPMCFSVIAGAVGWLAMCYTGGGVRHTMRYCYGPAAPLYQRRVRRGRGTVSLRAVGSYRPGSAGFGQQPFGHKSILVPVCSKWSE